MTFSAAFARVAALSLLCSTLAACASTAAQRQAAPTQVAAAPSAKGMDGLIAKHSTRYSVPERLVRRVIVRESRYNPSARNGPYWGLMQIRYDTARGLGYRGTAAGLLDADTNLTYGVAYLANAWKVSGGSDDRAVRLYAGGYYYEAKRKRMLGSLFKAGITDGNAAPIAVAALPVSGGVETAPATIVTARATDKGPANMGPTNMSTEPAPTVVASLAASKDAAAAAPAGVTAFAGTETTAAIPATAVPAAVAGTENGAAVPLPPPSPRRKAQPAAQAAPPSP